MYDIFAWLNQLLKDDVTKEIYNFKSSIRSLELWKSLFKWNLFE